MSEPPHVVPNVKGLANFIPTGNTSVKVRPVKVIEFVLVMVNIAVVAAPGRMGLSE